MNTVFIYALNEPCSGPDPTAGRTRYIGKAADPYARYEEHLSRSSKQRSHKAAWIRSLLKVNKTPILEILDEVPQAEWQLWEREWIRLYCALGFRLTNLTEGGQGTSGFKPSEETRAKVSKARKGMKFSETHKENLCKARARQVSSMKGKHFSEAARSNMRRARVGSKLSAESIAKRTETRRANGWNKRERS